MAVQENWDDLKMRAQAYHEMSEIALSQKKDHLIQNALEQAHLALELAMKSVIRKNNFNYSTKPGEGHNLDYIMTHSWSNGTRNLKKHIVQLADPDGISFCNVNRSLWTMDCRYKIMSKYIEMLDTTNEYRGFYIWIRDKLLS
jgi:hypothetical protein